MSRNLCTVECARCWGEVRLDEEPRPITRADAGVYFAEYDGMQVADATCPRCDARYLAWCEDVPGRGVYARTSEWRMRHFDLSYRSTFNDEPGDEDVPKPKVLARFDRLIEQLGMEQGPGSSFDAADFEPIRNVLAQCLGWKDA